MSNPASQGLRAGIYTYRFLISGKVQGVFYRKHTVKTATALQLTGWVRNLPDGRVEAVAEGPRAQLDALRSWCYTGSPKSAVTDVCCTDETAYTEEKKKKQNNNEKEEEVVGKVAPTQRIFSSFEVHTGTLPKQPNQTMQFVTNVYRRVAKEVKTQRTAQAHAAEQARGVPIFIETITLTGTNLHIRAFARVLLRNAEKLGVTGYIPRSTSPGGEKLVMICEGAREQLEVFKNVCHEGAYGIAVQDIEAEDCTLYQPLFVDGVQTPTPPTRRFYKSFVDQSA